MVRVDLEEGRRRNKSADVVDEVMCNFCTFQKFSSSSLGVWEEGRGSFFFASRMLSRPEGVNEKKKASLLFSNAMLTKFRGPKWTKINSGCWCVRDRDAAGA